MWILIRVALTVAFFYIHRHFLSRVPFRDATPFGFLESSALPAEVKHHATKNKQGTITSQWLIVDRPWKTPFAISAESGFDVVFKVLGVAHEFQTGDRVFDKAIYLESEDPHLARALTENPETKKLLIDTLSADGTRIEFGEGKLWIRWKGDASAAIYLDVLAKLNTDWQTKPVLSRPILDRIFWKAVIVESVAYSTLCYAGSSFLLTHIPDFPVHTEPFAIAFQGLLWAAVGFAAAMTLTYAFVAGTSRTGRLLLKAALCYLASFPVIAWQTIADANVELDSSESTIAPVTVTRKYTTTTRSRRGGSSTNYHLSLSPQNHPTAPTWLRMTKIPGSLRVSLSTFQSVNENQTLQMRVHPGRLNHPWIEGL